MPTYTFIYHDPMYILIYYCKSLLLFSQTKNNLSLSPPIMTVQSNKSKQEKKMKKNRKHNQARKPSLSVTNIRLIVGFQIRNQFFFPVCMYVVLRLLRLPALAFSFAQLALQQCTDTRNGNKKGCGLWLRPRKSQGNYTVVICCRLRKSYLHQYDSTIQLAMNIVEFKIDCKTYVKVLSNKN